MGARVWRGRRTAGGCRGQESEVSQEARSSQLECRCRALCARHGPNVVPCAETDQDTAATLICVNPAAFSKPTLTLAFLTLPLHFLVTTYWMTCSAQMFLAICLEGPVPVKVSPSIYLKGLET